MLATLPSSDFLGTVNWWPSSSRGASGGSSANCADAGGPSSCNELLELWIREALLRYEDIDTDPGNEFGETSA